MKRRRSHSLHAGLFAIGLGALVAGCASPKSETPATPVALSDLPAGARATVTRVTAGGQVDKITREVEKGKTVYDVEATLGGRHAEFLIADTDGAVLGTETQIEFSQLPQPVQAAVQKFFGTTTGLTVMKGDEYGETSYEVVGRKGQKTVEVTLDSAGKRTE